MNAYYSKHKPSIIHYRKFKVFNEDAFIKDLKRLLLQSFNEETILSQALRESVNATLGKYAPSKVRYTSANQASYVNKKTNSRKQIPKYQK